ncbi:MAG: PspC domain-containing protein [Acidimicrobiales bacterium]|jgi:phage shock protein PspC (stress-responsive transcriptional regulator)
MNSEDHTNESLEPLATDVHDTPAPDIPGTATNDEGSHDDHTRAEPSEPVGLRRSSSRRIIGGVASGIAERFDIDANVVRAIFVILACLWGFGVAVYLVLWVLVPRSGDKATRIEEEEPSSADRKKMTLWRTVLLIAGALSVGLIFLALYTNGPRWGSGIGSAWLILLVVLAVLSLRGPRRRFTLGRLISGFFLVVMSLLILAGGGFLAFLAMTGVPITGGIGNNVYTPTSVSQMRPTYRLAFGSINLDLRQVNFAGQTVSVTASVAAGDLTVEVPPGVVVDISTHGGVSVNYPQGFQFFEVPSRPALHQAHLKLDASVGAGNIQLIRAGPNSNQFSD